MESEKIRFLKAIEENRYDENTRKIFADWLEEHGYDDESLIQRSWTPLKQQSEDWLMRFAADQAVSYKQLIEAIQNYIKKGRYLNKFDNDDDYLYRDELFNYFEILTGTPVPQAKFHCEDWLREFAQDVEMSYGELMQITTNYVEKGITHCLPYDTPDRFYTDREELLNHYEFLTSNPVPDEKRNTVFVRCAC